MKYTEIIFRTSSSYTREFLAEALGTFVLVVIGCGALAQYTLYPNAASTNTSVGLAWACAVALGIIVSGKISGNVEHYLKKQFICSNII